MSPADMTASAELRAGLVRRLTELGLVAREPATPRLAVLPLAPVEQDRRAA